MCCTKGLSPDQQSFFVKEGGKVELDCRSAADSHPPAGMIWYKYNIPVQDISYRSFTADVLNLSKIALDNLLVADSGNYSCSFNNTERTFNRTFILRVFGESYHSFREFKKLRRQLQGKRHIKIELCVKLSLLRLFHVDHVVQNRRSALSLVCYKIYCYELPFPSEPQI